MSSSEPRLVLPPGFRFHPTDAEVVVDYLTPKALDGSFSCVVIADVDLNKTEPWDLPGKAKMGEKEWYFFCHKDRKYPTGMRTNRATARGYWKATGKDKEIYRGRGRGVLVGMKKTLVFYTGRAPRGEKTPWVMHEYRLDGKLPPNLPRSAKDEWAVCRVFNKDYLAAKPAQMAPEPTSIPLDLDDIFGVPPLEDSEYAVDDLLLDFKGAAAGMGQVKAEQQQGQGPSYFSLPAATNPHGAAEQAIRAHCKPEAPAPLPSPSTQLGGGDMSFPEVDDLLLLDDEGLFMDYSNMWNC